jgi:hypothetical protein
MATGLSRHEQIWVCCVKQPQSTYNRAVISHIGSGNGPEWAPCGWASAMCHPCRTSKSVGTKDRKGSPGVHGRGIVANYCRKDQERCEHQFGTLPKHGDRFRLKSAVPCHANGTTARSVLGSKGNAMLTTGGHLTGQTYCDFLGLITLTCCPCPGILAGKCNSGPCCRL